MDEIEKEQIVSAIYLAINNGNYRCAYTIFDMTMMEAVNKTLDQTIDLITQCEHRQLIKKIRQLKYKL